jgi:hypothetical protein
MIHKTLRKIIIRILNKMFIQQNIKIYLLNMIVKIFKVIKKKKILKQKKTFKSI